MYRVSGEVLGTLIARVSGQSPGAFMRQRIFDPLGMKDTAFHVPLTSEQRAGSEIFFGTHSSWGLGMAVDIRRNQIFHTPGRFG